MKRTIRLKEQALRNMIHEAVKSALNERDEDYIGNRQDNEMILRNLRKLSKREVFAELLYNGVISLHCENIEQQAMAKTL